VCLSCVCRVSVVCLSCVCRVSVVCLACVWLVSVGLSVAVCLALSMSLFLSPLLPKAGPRGWARGRRLEGPFFWVPLGTEGMLVFKDSGPPAVDARELGKEGVFKTRPAARLENVSGTLASSLERFREDVVLPQSIAVPLSLILC
jgi:hypothetical protein